MQDSNNAKDDARRAYRRPTLTQVPLRPEEAVLGNCKTSTTTGQNTGSGTTCTIFAPCSTAGS
jgi:hypothetical protein